MAKLIEDGKTLLQLIIIFFSFSEKQNPKMVSRDLQD